MKLGLYKIKKHLRQESGFSMVEIILALAIFAMIASAMVSLSLGGINALNRGSDHTEAQFLIQEVVEGLRSIKHSTWNEFIYDTSSISKGATNWEFDGEGTTETVGKFTREMTFEDVCRDSSDNIVDCPGDYIDPHTKKIKVTITWNVRAGIDNEVEHEIYFTNWDSKRWEQTDWVGGDGQAIWADDTMYDSDDGNIDYSIAGEIGLSEGIVAVPIDWGCAGVLDTGDTDGNVNATAVYMLDGYTYIVTTNNTGIDMEELYIFDTSDQENISLVGSLELGFNLYDIYVSGNYAYVATNDNATELGIIDVTTKSSPTLVGAFDAPSTANGMSVSGDGTVVYLGTYNNSGSEFHALDVSDPTTPVLLSGVAIVSNPRVYGISILGNYAYLATNGDTTELVVIDISDPASMTEVGTYDSPGTSDARRVFASGDYAYLAKYSGDEEFDIIDITTPASPVQKSSIEFNDNLNDVFVKDDYAFLGSNANDKEIVIVDLSRKEAPTIVGEIDVNSDVNGIIEKDDILYIAGEGNTEELKIYESAGNEGCFKGVGEADTETNQNAYAVFVEDGRTYLGRRSDTGAEFYIYDTSAPGQPIELGSLEIGQSVQDIFVKDDYAYLTTVDNNQELIIINITDPTDLSIDGFYNTPDGANGFGIFIKDSYAYLTTNQNSGDPEFYIIDVTDPTTPFLVGAYEYGTNLNMERLDIVGDYAYVATNGNSEELMVIDISVPATPTLAGVYDSPGDNNANSVEVVGDYAYLVKDAGDTEFDIIDITDHSAMTSVGNIDFSPTNRSLYDVVIDGDYAVLGSNHWGRHLKTVNISDKTAPRITVEQNMGGTTSALALDGNVLSLATSSNTAELTVLTRYSAGFVIDNSEDSFDTGVYSNTEFSGDYLQLNAAGLTSGAGDFTSDIFEIEEVKPWLDIFWLPEAPYGKALPDYGISETNYTQDNANMADNIMLFHMEETAGDPPDETPADYVYDTKAEFDTGVYTETMCKDTRTQVELTATGLTNGTGNYTSEIKNAENTNTSWDTISWSTEGPYGKELPNDGDNETDYAAGNANMDNIAVLYHMNEASGDVIDYSGNGNDGTNDSAGYGAAGLFDDAMDFSANDVSVDTGYIVSDGDYTFNIWMNQDNFTGDQVVGAHDGSNHRMYFGTRGNNFAYSFGAMYRNIASHGLSTGEWNMFTLVTDQSEGEACYYINGVLMEACQSYTFVGSSTDTFLIGRATGWGATRDIRGDIDEFAIFERELGAEEVKNLYKRGVLNIRHHVRSCDDAVCSGETFVGPDGTASTYYEEINNSSEDTPSFTITNVDDNQYFQYKTFFETDDDSISPILNSIEIDATVDSVPAVYAYTTKVIFDDGTYSDTVCSGDIPLSVELDGTDNDGEYTSEIIEGENSDNSWNTISWLTKYPYGKELPDDGDSEVDYSDGNANMSNIAVLYHMNEASGDIIDYSGNSNDGTNNGAGYGVTGLLKDAMDFSANDVDVDTGYAISNGDYTFNVWINFDNFTGQQVIGAHDGNNHRTYFGINGNNSRYAFGSNNRTVTAHGMIVGEWNLLTMTTDESEGEYCFYINGVLMETCQSYTFTGSSTDTFLIGRATGWGATLDIRGDIDEFSIFEREWSSDEIMDHYKRGMISVKYHVRSCDDAVCSGETFVGPDGTASTYYEEINNSSEDTPSFTITNVDDNQYFQYKTFFETTSGDFSPILEEVEINATEYTGGSVNNTVEDTSGNNNDGENEDATFQADGKLNKAMSFDGTDDYIEINDPVITDYPFTISAWIKTDTTGTEDRVIMNIADDATTNRYYGIFVGEDENGQVGIRARLGGHETVFSTTEVDDNEWHHVVGVFTSATSRELYVDGVSEVTDINSVAFSTDVDKWVIGRWGDSTPQSYFDGSIDEVAVFSRALTADEVLDNYLRGALNLKFQIRTCDDDACSGESFVGLDGTSATYYSELDNSRPVLSYNELVGLSDNRYFQYKAFFETTDNSYTSKLESIKFNHELPFLGETSGGFATTSYMLSSAFNMVDDSSVEVLEWDEDVSACDPVCDVKLQIRTAPDSSGSPGAWTDWYGSTGSGTYFEEPAGGLVDTDLNNNQWMQYRVELSGDGTATPILEGLRIDYR